MKNIGIIHYKVGGTDGVSLEINKWKRTLEEMGHRVHLCAGDLGTLDGTLIEELYHHRPEVERLNHNTFIELRDYPDEKAYQAELAQLTDVLRNKFLDFLEEKQIDLIIPNNVWSNSCSPPVSIALGEVVDQTQIPTIAHHHDFYWERFDGVALTCATAVELAEKYMPPRFPWIQHVVINSLAQQELYKRKGIKAQVIPNVFDFDGDGWQVDDYNADFRKRIGLQENDLIILQATRIVPKKGIELAVDFVAALNQPIRRAYLKKHGLYDGRKFNSTSKIVLVLTGYAQDEITGHYLQQLKDKVKRAGIEALFIENMVAGNRFSSDGYKIYSLWDTYVFADFVTYPSLWEGWGNQLLEALRAQLPLMLFEYPVYQADIKSKSLQVISLGSEIQHTDNLGLVRVDSQRIEQAADQALEMLSNPRSRQETVEHNYQVARQNYSLQALRDTLEGLVGS